MKKVYFLFLLIIFIFPHASSANTLSEKLSGKIVLQVEKNGEAWYINPNNNKRYYLGRPDDAFSLMRELGLGIKHTELISYLDNQFPEKLAGKILLDVEQNGEAYYIDPKDLSGYYLGRPSDAFSIMKNLGLGITNDNINKISIFSKNTSLEEIDNTWNLYTNNYFGFAIKLPKENWNSDCGKIIVDEYEDRVEIVGEKHRTECKSGTCYEYCGHWTLYISRVSNDNELESFIQDRYNYSATNNKACTIGVKKNTDQVGVYNVTTADCGLTFKKEIFYCPDNNIAITWNTGQDRSFVLENDVTADWEVIESLGFIDDNIKTSNYCTDEPTTNDMGRSIYPIDPRYSHLEHLGQFFTAYYCGKDRLNEIYNNIETYDLGSTIWLKEAPSYSMRATLSHAGYKCVETITSNPECKKWRFTDSVEMSQLNYRIEQYVDLIEKDDCINCG